MSGLPTVDVVRSGDGLDALRPAWLDLWLRVPDATPFQLPDWLIPWWHHFGEGTPIIVTMRRDGELVGLFPFYLRREPGVRKLLPVGVGLSDYLDPLLDPAHGREASSALAAWLAREANGFDRMDIMGLRAGSPLLRTAWPCGWAITTGPWDSAPVLALPHGVQRSRLDRLAYYRRRAERLGATELTRAEGPMLMPWLDHLFRLHGQRWTAKGEPGVLADPQVQAFHRAAARGLAERGMLHLFGLTIAGRPAAALYTLADASRWHAYIMGFDQDLPHPGLGAMMLGLVIEAGIAQGITELHLLRGREPYKYAWGAADQPLWGLSLTPRRALRSA